MKPGGPNCSLFVGRGKACGCFALPPLQLGQRPRRFLKQDLQFSPQLWAGHICCWAVGWSGDGMAHRGSAGTVCRGARWVRRWLCSNPPTHPGDMHCTALLLATQWSGESGPAQVPWASSRRSERPCIQGRALWPNQKNIRTHHPGS